MPWEWRALQWPAQSLGEGLAAPATGGASQLAAMGRGSPGTHPVPEQCRCSDRDPRVKKAESIMALENSSSSQTAMGH